MNINEQREITKEAYRESLRNSLTSFLRDTKTSKSKFAELYGCRPNYLSNLLNGSKSIDFAMMSKALNELGYGVEIRAVDLEFQIDIF